MKATLAIAIPHFVSGFQKHYFREVEELDSYSSVIRTCLSIADAFFFIGLVGIENEPKAAFAQFKAGIETSGENGSGKRDDGHNAAEIIKDWSRQIGSGESHTSRQAEGVAK